MTQQIQGLLKAKDCERDGSLRTKTDLSVQYVRSEEPLNADNDNIEVQKSRLLKAKDRKTDGPLRYDNRFIGTVRKVRGAANADNDNYRSPKIAAPQTLTPL
jgi:hypothetical protein